MISMIAGTRSLVVMGLVTLVASAAPALGDTPPQGRDSGSLSSQDFTQIIQEALRHAREADAAGTKGDAEALKKHAHKAIEKAKEGQRAGHNEKLNDGVYALGDAIEHAGEHTKDATEHVKRAIMKLSQSAGLHVPEGVPTGETRGRSAASDGTRQATALTGGYLDDGFVDDDWFFDYYQPQFSERGGPQVSAKDYQAEQLYEDARASGLFDF
jgi:hypothetical protein